MREKKEWRRGWDSNPRAGKPDHLISSQRRYDRFGTSPEPRILTFLHQALNPLRRGERPRIVADPADDLHPDR